MAEAGGEAAPRLRWAAMRLAAELDAARLHQAAAYASMAADALAGESDAGEPHAIDTAADFELDEHGRVWMLHGGECRIIGSRNAVCARMLGFIAAVVLGGAQLPGEDR